MVTTLYMDFSDAQGQITMSSVMVRNSNAGQGKNKPSKCLTRQVLDFKKE